MAENIAAPFLDAIPRPAISISTTLADSLVSRMTKAALRANSTNLVHRQAGKAKPTSAVRLRSILRFFRSLRAVDIS
jgi:hypothetical protein